MNTDEYCKPVDTSPWVDPPRDPDEPGHEPTKYDKLKTGLAKAAALQVQSGRHRQILRQAERDMMACDAEVAKLSEENFKLACDLAFITGDSFDDADKEQILNLMYVMVRQ